MRIKELLQPAKTLLADQRVAAGIITDVLLELKRLTTPGTSLDMLDELAERMILEAGGTPYNKGYQPAWSPVPYPSTICASVDYEACHAPPRGRTLSAGSIVKYDLGVRYKTGCGDAALTVAVGEIDNRKQRLMRYSLQAFYEGVKVVKAGVPISAIGRAIEKFAEPRGYKIIKEFSGHHIGREMHEQPPIPSFARPADDNVFLEAGKIICIEPMFTPGKGWTRIAPSDGWTAYCPDGQPVAMFEHMVLVKEDGYEILTKHISKP